MYYQEGCTTEHYKKSVQTSTNDQIPYWYPLCITGEVWNAYVNNPFDFTTRKEFLSTISLSCIDEKKGTNMMPPYALTLKIVTTDVGLISSQGKKKIDARMYNGYLLTPGIVYHIADYRNPFEIGIINFITQFGNFMRKGPYVTIHGAYSGYINMNATYINGCVGKEQIIPVTMFLVVLYNACFMYQKDNKSNLLIAALDTFDSGPKVDHEIFMNTLSECND
jgi:hypothetical protein